MDGAPDPCRVRGGVDANQPTEYDINDTFMVISICLMEL